jgi:hypothetical protein
MGKKISKNGQGETDADDMPRDPPCAAHGWKRCRVAELGHKVTGGLDGKPL